MARLHKEYFYLGVRHLQTGDLHGASVCFNHAQRVATQDCEWRGCGNKAWKRVGR